MSKLKEYLLEKSEHPSELPEATFEELLDKPMQSYYSIKKTPQRALQTASRGFLKSSKDK